MIYVGIDIGKYQHEALALDDNGRILTKSLRFKNTKEGFSRFLSFLEDLRTKKGKEVKLACEATGHYWMNLYHFLRGKELPLVVVNPLQTQAQRKAHIRRTKTDKRDALMIAKLLRLGELHLSYVPEKEIFYLRELTRFRFGLADTIGDLKRQIIAILDKVFPEYQSLFSNSFLKSARAILENEYLPSELVDLDLEELTKLLRENSNGHFKEEKAKELKEKAKNSVGLSFLEDVAKLKISLILPQIKLCEKSLKRLDNEIAKIYQRGNYSKHLLTIPGINEVLAASILAELGDIKRFKRLSQLVAFAGLDPSTFESGEFKGTISHLSKRGSAHLRRALYLATVSSIKKDKELGFYFKRKQAQGKHYTMAAMATARKLLARIYTILKEDRPYEIR